jgi:hypothetical protein
MPMNRFIAGTLLVLIACFASPVMAMSKDRAIAECRAMFQSMHRYAAPEAFKACVADKMRQ